MMKKIFVLFGIFISLAAFSQVKWMSIQEAISANKSVPKKIFIDFYADWCAPCKIMDKQTYANPVIAAAINENYYPVKFMSDGNEKFELMGRVFTNPDYKAGKSKNLHEYTKYMNVNMLPSIVLLDENVQPITILNGALTARELEPYLPFFAKDEYKKIQTREQWDDYQKKFKSKLKN